MRAFDAADRSHDDSPKIFASPRVGRISPGAVLISVVLPAAFCPSSPTTEPTGIDQSTPSSAATLWPKYLRTPCSSSGGEAGRSRSLIGRVLQKRLELRDDLLRLERELLRRRRHL